MTRDEHERTALMGGSAFQETGMDDYLTRVAEAVRDAALNKAWQIGNNGPLRSAVDLPAVIASVPRPEPVAWRHSHAHSLHDLAADVELADGDEWAEPLYAEPVAAQQSDDAATLRSAIGQPGYGDYIIMKIGADGMIAGWQQPDLDPDDWEILLAPVAPAMSDAARDVLAERQRQISVEGWTPEHDDAHADYKLSSAAGCYAMFTLAYPAGDPASFWPWDKSWWKPSADQRRNLVKAGALILAEIERLDRAALASAKGGAA